MLFVSNQPRAQTAGPGGPQFASWGAVAVPKEAHKDSCKFPPPKRL